MNSTVEVDWHEEEREEKDVKREEDLWKDIKNEW